MPFSIMMPALSPTMTQGNLVAWRKQPGDQVVSGDVLFDIETDKAVMEVEAVDEGILGPHHVAEGTSGVAVGTLLAHLYAEGETMDEPLDQAHDISSASPAPSPAPLLPSLASSLSSSAPKMVPGSTLNAHQKITASPLAKRLAAQQGIDISLVKPKRRDGLVVKRDILAYTLSQGVEERITPSDPLTSDIQSSPSPLGQRHTPTALRRHIGQRLQAAYQEIPHFFLTVDITISRLMSLRAEINATQETLGKPRISVNDFFIKASGIALKACPQINACWADGDILSYDHADIAVAVSIPGGLITPIVTQTEVKTLSQISQTMRELVDKAKNNKLKPHEFKGGSFTISNLGMYGISSFMPIINPPHAALLALGAGQKRAVVQGESLAIAEMLSATMAVDHRIVDGVEAAHFLATLREIIENPLQLLI